MTEMCGYYESISGFRYWDVKAWKQYIQQNIAPLYSITTTLLEVRDELAPYTGNSFGVITNSRRELLPFLAGGIKDGDYSKYSLAKLTRLIYGLYVDPREFSSAVSSLGEEGLSEVVVKAEEKESSVFLRLISGLNRLSGNVLELADIGPSEISIPSSGEIIKQPEKILDVLKEFYRFSISFSANHNYYTFFIVSTRGTHWKALREGYHKLEENLDEIKEFLGLEEIFIPETGKEDVQRDYTIWSHSRGEIAESIYSMQIGLWGRFNFEVETEINKPIEDALRYITKNPEDLAKGHIRLVKDALGDPREIHIGNERFYPKDSYDLKIEGLWITDWPNETLISSVSATSAARDVLKREHSKPKLSFIEFLDQLGPYLFTGYGEISRHPKHKEHLKYYGNIPMNAVWWLG
ncbi:hypothetical protein [Thermococcus sp.]|uniref:hypothetical protein n=1 Tax=Thermococcus sp. TaxID=35749 RepID=UPI00260DFD5C|nr:hypothetical protein [Thermococcus sp.]